MNVYLSALLVALVLTSADQSLRDTARAHGGVATNSIDYFEPVTSVNTLMTKADYVVHARVLQSRAVLIFNDMLVATEYTIMPLEVLKQGPTLSVASRPGMPPNAAVVRRVGGTMVEGQYRYSTTNGSVPEEEAPKIGDE